MRGIGVFLDNVGAVSIFSVLDGLAGAGRRRAEQDRHLRRADGFQTLVVTANTSTLYAYRFTDLAKDGPTVIEIPPGMLGFLDDGWQRFVGNMGVTGPDKGKGGKYLVIPPGYTGESSGRLFPAEAAHQQELSLPAGFIKDGLKPAVENFTSGLKVYPLKDAANPAPTEFVNMSGRAFNTVFPSDFDYFEILTIVQARTDRSDWSGGTRLHRHHRHRQGTAIRARRADEEAVDRGGIAG